MSTLGSRARRIQATMLQPLDILKGEVIYHLTALELQIEPWMSKVWILWKTISSESYFSLQISDEYNFEQSTASPNVLRQRCREYLRWI